MNSLNQIQYLKDLEKSWPEHWRMDLSQEIKSHIPERHPLHSELEAFRNDQAACLPFFGTEKVLWITTAPKSEALLGMVENLRSWIIPGFGWEDKLRPIVSPGNKVDKNEEVVLNVSPSGFFRWWCRREDLDLVIKKLQTFRFVEAKEPVNAFEDIASLYELRHLYHIALADGDREIAEYAIRRIDEAQLDSAVNTLFMTISVFDRFEDYKKVIRLSKENEVLLVYPPPKVRSAVANAYYFEYLQDLVIAREYQKTRSCFREDVFPLLTHLLDYCRREDGQPISRLLALKARETNDANLAKSLSEVENDEFISSTLATINVETQYHRTLNDPEVEIVQLIEDDESDRVEFKSSLRKNLVTGNNDTKMEMMVLKTVAAFLNTNGGTLIVGIEDNKNPIGIEVDGFKNQDSMSLHLVTKVKHSMGAISMTYVHPEFRQYKGFTLMVIKCERSNSPVFVREGINEMFYIRTGPATSELPASQMLKYISENFA